MKKNPWGGKKGSKWMGKKYLLWFIIIGLSSFINLTGYFNEKHQLKYKKVQKQKIWPNSTFSELESDQK